MSLDEAVDLVIYALQKGKHKDLWVYKNKSCTIKELADLFSDNQEVLGHRCEEKTDEALLTVNELNHSAEYGNYIRVNEEINNDYPAGPYHRRRRRHEQLRFVHVLSGSERHGPIDCQSEQPLRR